jgi:hypothetical protein
MVALVRDQAAPVLVLCTALNCCCANCRAALARTHDHAFFCCIKEHLDVAKTLNNLAIINKAMGDNHQALKNYQRVAWPRGF